MLFIFFYMCEKPEGCDLSKMDWKTHRRIKTQIPVVRQETDETIQETIYVIYEIVRLQKESLDDILTSVAEAVAPRLQAYDDSMRSFRQFKQLHEERIEFEMTPDEKSAVMSLAMNEPTCMESLGFDYESILEKAVQTYGE